ncbi:hypothetical protein HHI36_014339 [Cryptolaemus montrouzieri]|uniref:DNA-directed RNA polymerase n=1 Tax=Cryptolaemus montrouzieri TaxID=559131 RepID=A0ABD2N2K6_9CUCU
MYRLLKFKSSRSNSLTRLSLNNEILLPEKSCLFCRILQNNTPVTHRYRSTIINPNPVMTQKARKKRSKRFNTTELLEVSNKLTLQRTTKIQTASANDLKKLLEISTAKNKLKKIKNPTKDVSYVEEHTYNNLNVINQFCSEENSYFTSLPDNDQRIISMLRSLDLSSIPLPKPIPSESMSKEDAIEDIEENFNLEPVPEGLKIDNTSDILDSIPRIHSSFQPETLEDTTESHEEDKETPEEKIIAVEKANKQKPIDLRAKREIIHKTLAAFVEVCSLQKLHHKALNAILFLQSKSKYKSGISIDNIDIFNALLKGYASDGDVKKVFETLKIMSADNIKYNIQTYIIILQCLGRNSNQGAKYIERLKRICHEALKNGFTFDRMMNEGSYLKDEREHVLKAIQTFDPSYRPKYKNPVVQYDNELLNDLNHDDQLKAPMLEICKNDGLFSVENLRERVTAQIALEKQITVTVKNIEATEKPSAEVLQYRESLIDHYKVWTESATRAFNRDLFSLSARRGAMNNEVYLKCIPVEDYVKIIIDEAKKLAEGSETYSPTVNMLYRALGQKVYDRYKVLRKQDTGVLDKILSIHNTYCVHYAASHKKLDVLPTSGDNLNSRQKWQWIEHSLKPTGSTLEMDHKAWVPSNLVEIGKFLYHIIMHDLMIDVNCMKPNAKNKKLLPAFYTIFRSQGRIIKEEVKPHPMLSKLYRSSVPETLTFPVSDVPMVCPPLPWTSVDNGGYLITYSDVVRLPIYALSQKQKMKSTNIQNLYPSLDSLNQLAAVPWKVNTKILDLILKVFNSGGSDKLDVPKPSSSLPPPEPPKALEEMDKLQRYHFFRQKLQYRRHKAEMYSLRCDCLYRLSLANHFRDEIFWLPHNMDFRGRVYPVPPHLNHLGSDLARSILVFAEPRPLGPKGLDWLKIHLINLTGLKKRDRISDRLQYANECMDLILDSVDHPLDGKQWWADSDEPWQTLACCMEIAAAIRSGDPENFKSHFPVHQDGSCNGLQHYAALGRDKAGGFSVNLCPADVPQDVYSAVVNLVEERRKKDADNGVEIAKLLDGFIKRKVIKQTIMTTVYGVTKFGARLQIAKQLKDIEDFPKQQVFAASHYLTTKTFESLRTMFTSTKEIQDWFTECARLISAVAGHHMEWITPMGLPIVQPYFKPLRKAYTNSFCESYYIDKYEKPHVMKQKNAFPPNFIHSLDSSHMMLTSLNCERAGITFVSVHDCYWTHASTVEIMNKICREQFVALHSQPILEDLSIYLSKHYSYGEEDLTHDGSVIDLTKKKLNRVLGNLPRTGDLDINQVLKSVYFFS